MGDAAEKVRLALSFPPLDFLPSMSADRFGAITTQERPWRWRGAVAASDHIVSNVVASDHIVSNVVASNHIVSNFLHPVLRCVLLSFHFCFHAVSVLFHDFKNGDSFCTDEFGRVWRRDGGQERTLLGVHHVMEDLDTRWDMDGTFIAPVREFLGAVAAPEIATGSGAGSCAAGPD